MHNIILEKVDNSEEIRIDIFSRLVQNRIIFIDDLISDKATADVLSLILFLDRENQNKITLFINAECGDIRNVFAIYDAMKLASSPLETFCIGSAMREAVLLVAAGTKGYRIVTQNADICVSQVVSPYVSHGDLTNTQISHQKTVRDNNAFLKELAKNTGKSFKELKKDTERQLFLTPNQAVKYGIADRVV